uniref:Uncharacterized protein n=1 Tax=Cucumis melo TaxID=3656 RepID=A0A9I9DUR3_CUCME
MVSKSKKLDFPTPNLNCSHVSNEDRNLRPLARNVCPLELGNDRGGLGSIDNEEFVDDSGHESDIEFKGDDDVHGLHMFDSNAQLHYEVNIDNEHEILKSDKDESPHLITKKKQKRVEKLMGCTVFLLAESYLEDVQ